MVETSILRSEYADRIRAWAGKPVIKALVGIRRCGKSVLLRQAADVIAASGIPRERIHYFDMERLANDALRAPLALHDALRDRPTGAVLIDEVQEISGWERLTASLLGEGWDVWVTGSNAHLLSSELATLLTGRYIELPVFPLGLAEFRRFRAARGADEREDFETFLRWGGLPGLHALDWAPTLSQTYLEGVLDSIVLKDVVARFGVRNVPLLQRLMRFVASSVGSPFSANSVVKFLKSQRAAVSVETVQTYLDHLAAAFLVHPVRRWDIRGKRHLEFGEKYFLGDTGLFAAALGQPGDINAVLENLVFLELKRRGARVSTGREGDHEVDFVAEFGSETHYVQVAYLLTESATRDRELRPLLSIPDHHPKLVLSLDPLPVALPGGVRHGNAQRFLMGERLGA